MPSRLNTKTAFSLVELMCVVGLISIISNFAFFKSKNFKIKAGQTEGLISLKHIETLQESYYQNDGKYYSGVLSSMTYADYFLNVSACNLSNPIGFRILNCLKANYYCLTSSDVTGLFGQCGGVMRADGVVKLTGKTCRWLYSAINVTDYYSLTPSTGLIHMLDVTKECQ